MATIQERHVIELRSDPGLAEILEIDYDSRRVKIEHFWGDGPPWPRKWIPYREILGIVPLKNSLKNYLYLANQPTVITRMQNGVRTLEINGRLLQKIELDQLLNRLPFDERQAVMLVKVHGLSLREAADVLGVSHMTIQRRVEKGAWRMLLGFEYRQEWAKKAAAKSLRSKPIDKALQQQDNIAKMDNSNLEAAK